MNRMIEFPKGLFAIPNTYRYFGGGGGGKAPAMPAMPAPAPVKVPVAEEKAKLDLKERLRRARSRALSQVADIGLLEQQPAVIRPMLSDLL